jgi:hypothetical protein
VTVCGCPIGTRRYIETYFHSRLTTMKEQLQLYTSLAGTNEAGAVQAALILARFCAAPRMLWPLRTVAHDPSPTPYAAASPIDPLIFKEADDTLEDFILSLLGPSVYVQHTLRPAMTPTSRAQGFPCGDRTGST